VKPKARGRKILQHAKDPLTYPRYWYAKFRFFVHSCYSLPDVSASTIVRELW
jgi:hypothetical protein